MEQSSKLLKLFSDGNHDRYWWKKCFRKEKNSPQFHAKLPLKMHSCKQVLPWPCHNLSIRVHNDIIQQHYTMLLFSCFMRLYWKKFQRSVVQRSIGHLPLASVNVKKDWIKKKILEDIFIKLSCYSSPILGIEWLSEFWIGQISASLSFALLSLST